MADERNFTADQHAAILETEVKRQTADLRVAREGLEAEKSALQTNVTALETEKAALLQRIDKLDAEKAAAEKAKTDAETELADFKASVTRAAEVASLKAVRSEAVKAQLAGIGDEYFTPERTQRWAEMTEAQFATVLADLAETSAALKKKAPKFDKDGKPVPDEDEKAAEDTEKAARETAAFKGGADPTAGTTSTFMQLMAARRPA